MKKILLNITRILFGLSVCIAISSNANAQGNAGDRGGGDPYAAEIYHLSTGIGKKLRTWTTAGILKLTENQLANIEKLVGLNRLSRVQRGTLTVYSFDHVYRYPELLPSPEADEVTLVNVYRHHPPRIEVGRVRWDALKGENIEKEMMVLHELIGAAGILKHGRRLDDHFFISYELKLKSQREWIDFKEQLKSDLIAIHSFNNHELSFTSSEKFKFFGQAIESSPDYDLVLNPPSQKERMESYHRVQNWVKKSFKGFLGEEADPLTSADQAKLQSFADDLSKLALLSHPTWNSWAQTIYDSYSRKFGLLKIRHFFQTTKINGGSAWLYDLQLACDNAGDLDVILKCYVRKLQDGMTMVTRVGLDDSNGELDRELYNILDQIALKVSPDDLN